MPDHRVLSVGQCSADHSSISAVLQRHFNAVVVPAATLAEAEKLLGAETFSLVMVNRILDEDGSKGLALIQRLKQGQSPAAVPMMIVSNHADAQTEAVAAGAVAGFGKSALGQPAMLDRVRPFLT